MPRHVARQASPQTSYPVSQAQIPAAQVPWKQAPHEPPHPSSPQVLLRQSGVHAGGPLRFFFFFLRFFLAAVEVAPMVPNAVSKLAMAARREWANRRRRSSNWRLSMENPRR